MMDNTSSMPWLGIDFGTCQTSAALMIGGVLRQVNVGYGPRRHVYDMPTAVYIEQNGDILAGELAVNARFKDPSRFTRQFKLQIGNPRGITVPVSGAGRTYQWYELIGAVLSHIRHLAEREFNNNRPLRRVVLTVPAIYSPDGAPWSAMKQAATHAGFDEVRIVREPHAAAIFYDYILSESNVNPGPEGEIALVYDLGGGTFDPAIIRRYGQRYEILGANAEGGVQCGGIFFDEKIRKHFQEACPQAIQAIEAPRRTSDGTVHPEDASKAARYARDLRNLEDFLIEIKHRFSYPEVESVEDLAPPLLDTIYRLSRTEFNAILRPMVSETIRCCMDLMHRSGITWKEIRRIILVGGSCHLPLISDQLRAAAEEGGAAGIEICWKRIAGTDQVLDPSFAVCLGAALASEFQYISRRDASEKTPLPPSGPPPAADPKPAVPNRTDYRVEEDIFGPFSKPGNK